VAKPARLEVIDTLFAEELTLRENSPWRAACISR
jgi:hypothetical protein